MIEVRKPLVLIFIILLGIASILVGGKPLYFILFLSVFLYLTPLLWLLASLYNLKGSIEVSARRAEVGNTLTVTYSISTSSGRFPYLELANVVGSSFQDDYENRIVTLDSNDSAIFEKRVMCNRRGIYSLQDFKVKTGDPFSFFKLSKSLTSDAEVIIYPKIVSPDINNLSARQYFGDLVVNEKYFENISLISDLRNWYPGDNIKKIHWKQTARQGNIVVKNFENKGDASPKIFIDMNKKNYRLDSENRLEDLAVSTAASLIYYFLVNGVTIDVLSELIPGSLIKGRSYDDFTAIMDKVITLTPVGKVDYASFLNTYRHYFSSKGALYIISPSLTSKDVSILLYLKQKGYFITLCYLTKNSLELSDTESLEQLRSTGINLKILSPGS